MKKIWVGMIIAGTAFVCLALFFAVKEETGAQLVRIPPQRHALTNSPSDSTAAVQQREKDALLAAKFVPRQEQTAPRAQLPQDTRKQALSNGQQDSGTVATAADRQQARRERNRHLARKFALIKERSALLQQGNKEALDANSAAIFAADATYINKQINKKEGDPQ